MSDVDRKKLRETGQAPASRDRVGGGMQRSSAASDQQPVTLAMNGEFPWIVRPDCTLCWVHFTEGVADYSCACIRDLIDGTDGS